MPDHIPTLADVCSAIAEGHLIAASDGSTYQVSAFQLRRHFNKRQSFPTISFLEDMLAPTTYPDSPNENQLDYCRYGH